MSSYDLEDAMILNKSSYERGFAHASVYKTECIDLVDERNKATRGRIFHRPAKEAISAKVLTNFNYHYSSLFNIIHYYSLLPLGRFCTISG